MAQDKPLISVIMLCYNQHQFVAEAIDGILGQTYSPLEVVIVDDCSSDSTADVIAAHIAKRGCENSVTFIRNPRNLSGRVSCINGLNMTGGSFVLQTCGDDVMMPEMIAEMANVWLRENVSLVTTNAIYIDESSRPLNRTFRDSNIPADDSFETLARDGSNACCFGPAIGFERELYTKFGWPPAYLGAYDIMLPFYAYLLKGAQFVFSPLLKYRVHRGNTSLSLRAEIREFMGKGSNRRAWLSRSFGARRTDGGGNHKIARGSAGTVRSDSRPHPSPFGYPNGGDVKKVNPHFTAIRHIGVTAALTMRDN